MQSQYDMQNGHSIGALSRPSLAGPQVLEEGSRSQTASPTTVRGKKIWMPSVFCQFSMSESMPAVRIRSMSEQVMTGTSHDLQQCNTALKTLAQLA